MNRKYIKYLVALVVIISCLFLKFNNYKNKSFKITNLKYMTELEKNLKQSNDNDLFSTKYLITDDTIERIRENTTGNELKDELGVIVYEDDTLTNKVDNDIIKSGMKAIDKNNNIYTLVVHGDVNKDGKVNSIDVTRMIRNELNDEVDKKASNAGIDNIKNQIVYGNMKIDAVEEIKAPSISVIDGNMGDNDYYLSDVSIKIKPIDNDGIKTVYKILGSFEQDITEITDDAIILNKDGVYKIVAYTYGKLGNKSKASEKIIKINKTDIVATISYSTSEKTTDPVTATITFNKDNVIINNNDGKNTYQFLKNGEFVFEYSDEAGRSGNMPAVVDWIYKKEYIGADGIWSYIINDDNTIQLTKYLGNSTEINIPSMYDDYKVVSVGNQYATDSNRLNIFDELENNTITKVTFEEGIETIENSAFANCTGITGNIVFPSTLKKIGDSAFINCTGITGDLTIPDSVTYLGIRSFQSCTGLDGTVKLPDGLKEISNYSFNRCSNIKKVIFPEELEIIGRTSFQLCSSLSGELNIPPTVKKIDDYAFNKCSSLTGDIIIPNSVTYVGRAAFQNNTGFKGKLILSDNLTQISDYAFYGCSNLTGDIEIKEGVTSIGDGAFGNCNNLNGTLTLPSTLTSIGSGAFNQCNKLTGDLIIPDGVEYIGDIAFQSLTKMTGILHLPSNIKSIGYFAFYDSKFSGELILPEGLETMGRAVFGKCTNFENEKIVIPSTLKKIGNDQEFDGENLGLSTHDFYNFGASKNKFTEFVVDPNNQYFKTDNGVLYTIDGKRLISYPKSKPDIQYEILEGVITIDELSISSNTILDTLIIPDSLNLDVRDIGIRIPNETVLTSAQYSYTEINNIVVKDTNPKYKSVDGVVYTKDMKEVVYISPGRTSQVIIPDGVESFKDKSLYWNQVYYIRISKMYIPASVTTISNSVIERINSNARVVEVAEDNPYFTVDANNKLIRK